MSLSHQPEYIDKQQERLKHTKNIIKQVKTVAEIPAVMAEINKDEARLYPFLSAVFIFMCAYTGKYIAEKGISLKRHADAPYERQRNYV